ncbi:cyclic nucleotide-binding/CBS domain-containing protein [candidate division KSB1 bacterium]
METKRVTDIMMYLDEYPAIINTATLRDAIELMNDFQIDFNGQKSLPRILLVMDKEDHIVGLVRRRDIVRGLLPDFIKGRQLEYRKKLFDVKVDPHLLELSFEKLTKNIKTRAETPISEVVTADIITVDYDAHLLTAIHKMVQNDITLLPVMNKGKVVGIVRSVDVFNEIAKIILKK